MLREKIVITWHYMKDNASIGMTSNSFGVTIVFAVIAEGRWTISSYMGPKFISLPKHKAELKVKVDEFEAKFGMKKVFGFIDGTHIPIKCLV